METKSNNLLVGSFTLLVLGALFVFALWVGRVQLDRTYAYYELVFEGSVSGLRQASTVQYNGIPVGRVIDLHLAEDDPRKVVAVVQLDARTPVKTDSVARLELSGITGSALIQLSGGSPEAPQLETDPGEPYPEIPTEPSALQEIYTSAPEALENANQLIAEVRSLVNENRSSIHQIVANLEQISATAEDQSGTIRQTLKNMETASAQLTQLMQSAEGFTRNAERFSRSANDVADELRPAAAEMSETLASYRRLADRLNALVDASSGPVDRFSQEGLSQVPALLSETRSLVTSINGLIARVEENPVGFVAGRSLPEVDAQ